MNEFLAPSTLLELQIDPAFSYLAYSLLLLLIAFNRFYELRTLDTNDPASQLFYAIKSSISKSVCPRIISSSYQQGWFHYPLSYYWHCSRFVIFILKRLDIDPIIDYSKKPSNQPLFRYVFQTIATLNILIFPVLVCILFAFFNPILDSQYLVDSIGILAFLAYIHTLFPRIDYPVNTRSVGYFLVYLFLFSVLAFHSTNTSDLSILGKFTEGYGGIHMNSLIFFTLLTCILYFILQSSQQGAYVFISSIVAYIFCFPEFAVLTIGVICSSCFFFLQLDYLDLFHNIRAHFYHRIHMHEWSQRTYGKHRYKLQMISLRELMRLSFSYSFFDEGFNEELSKKNWISVFMIHRSYIYIGIILIYSVLSRNYIFSPLLIFGFTSAVVPGFITLSSTFSGYGPPSLPITFLLPFNIVLLFHSIHSFPDSSGLSFLIFIVLIDTLIGLLRFLYFIIALIPSLIKNASHDFSGILGIRASLIQDKSSSSAFKVFDFIVALKPLKTIKIVSYGVHYQALLEAAFQYRLISSKNVNNIENSDKLQLAFSFVDNIRYGWRADQVSFDLSPQVLNRLKPDLILINPSRSGWLQQICSKLPQSKVHETLIFTSGPDFAILRYDIIRYT